MDIMKKQRVPLSQRMPCLNPDYPQHYQQLFLSVLERISRQQYTSETNRLIQQLIPFGQNNYSCWVAKKKIFESGNTTIEHEDQYSKNMLDKIVKNFQIWDYRYFVCSITKNYQKQYMLMDQILQGSPRNYHLWAFRTTLVDIVKNYGEEMSRTEIFILKDYYNNSAWNYRAFCFNHSPVKDYQTQFNFVFHKIKKYMDNQAPWNYLRGFFPCYTLSTIKSIPSNQQQFLNYSDYPIIKQTCEEIVQNKQISEQMKIHALMTLLIINSHCQDTVKYAKQICGYLAGIEPLRSNYYNWLKNAL